MYMLLDSLCAKQGNSFPQKFVIKRKYHDVMYFNIDAGRQSTSSPADHSVKNLIQRNIVIIILNSCFRGKYVIDQFGHHSQRPS